MHGRILDRVATALALSAALSAVPLSAASAGGHGAGGFHRVGTFRGGLHPGFRGGFAGYRGGLRLGDGRGLPPVAGVIHEGPAGRPSFSAYGHTNTALRFGSFPRGGVPGYGHVGTGLHLAGGRRFDRLGFGRRRFAEGGYGSLGGFGAGYGGYAGGFGGGYGAAGAYGRPGTYGGQGTYGQPGAYGGQGSYGSTATQAGFGGGGFVYRSETPLAARFAEPPLAPSPYAPFSPGDRYAYAAAADVGRGPRVLNPYRGASYRVGGAGPVGCACGPRREPVIYRYGVGTAY